MFLHPSRCLRDKQGDSSETILIEEQRLHATGAGGSITFTHDAGAVALVKHRGKYINTRSEVAIRLLNAVHTQVVRNVPFFADDT